MERGSCQHPRLFPWLSPMQQDRLASEERLWPQGDGEEGKLVPGSFWGGCHFGHLVPIPATHPQQPFSPKWFLTPWAAPRSPPCLPSILNLSCGSRAGASILPRLYLYPHLSCFLGPVPGCPEGTSMQHVQNRNHRLPVSLSPCE